MVPLDDENLSLNSQELNMIEENKNVPKNQDLSIIHKKCRFYTYRECNTCNI